MKLILKVGDCQSEKAAGQSETRTAFGFYCVALIDFLRINLTYCILECCDCDLAWRLKSFLTGLDFDLDPCTDSVALTGSIYYIHMCICTKTSIMDFSGVATSSQPFICGQDQTNAREKSSPGRQN